MLLTNSREESYCKHLRIATEKFIARGYPQHVITHCATKKPWHLKHTLLAGRPDSEVLKVIPFKLRFFPELHELRIVALAHRLFDRYVNNGEGRFVSCHLASMNLFRRRYGRFVNPATHLSNLSLLGAFEHG